MRVLVVAENDRSLAVIQTMISKETVICDGVLSPQNYAELDRLGDHDAVILDLMDRQRDEALEYLRAGQPGTPILILLSDSELGRRLEAVSSSTVQFVNKPLDHNELMDRLYTMVRCAEGAPALLIRAGELVVDPGARVAKVNDRAVPLTAKEFGILELLALRKGTTVTKEMFLRHLYGGSNEPEMKIIDVFVCKLRKKLAQASGGKHYIHTVWGRGYALRDPRPVADPTYATPEAGRLDTDRGTRSVAA